MGVTALSIAQTCASRLGLAVPLTLVVNYDNNVMLLKAMIERTAQEIREGFAWPQLEREWTITLATNTDSYAFPGDFNRIISETWWNRTQKWPLIGPIDPVQWQQYKSGLVTTLPRQRFRVKYWADAQFFIDPTPTSSENGQTVVFEYITRTLWAPKTWVTGDAYSSTSYCSYNGNIYYTALGGVTGATPPTHTSGSVSDGGVTWTYQSTFYDTIRADTDQTILDPQLIIEGAIWRWKEEKGYDFESLKFIAEANIDSAKTKLTGASILTVNNWRMTTPMIGVWSYPEGNY